MDFFVNVNFDIFRLMIVTTTTISTSTTLIHKYNNIKNNNNSHQHPYLEPNWEPTLPDFFDTLLCADELPPTLPPITAAAEEGTTAAAADDSDREPLTMMADAD